MMRPFHCRGVFAVTAMLLLVICAWQAPRAAEIQPIEIVTQSGGAVRFDVEIAVTPQERATGLMFRRELGRDRGMLFDFGDERVVSMWMRNTYVPLDMIFIGDDRVIKHIAARTTPLSERTISSRVPVRFVLEINAGFAGRLGIATGDPVAGDAIENR